MPKKSPSNLDQPIEELDLKAVNNLRKRISRTLKGVAVAGAVSLTAGHIAGAYGESEFRTRTGYNPDETAETEKVRTEENASEAGKREKIPKDESLFEIVTREGKEKLEKARQWAKKEINEESDKVEIIREYREGIRQMKEIKQYILETGDKIAYWLPFLLVFLATIKLARLTMTANKKIRDFLDPERMKKFDEIEKKTNQIIARVNLLSEKVQEGGEITAEMKAEIEALAEEFEETSGVIEKEGTEEDAEEDTELEQST